MNRNSITTLLILLTVLTIGIWGCGGGGGSNNNNNNNSITFFCNVFEDDTLECIPFSIQPAAIDQKISFKALTTTNTVTALTATTVSYRRYVVFNCDIGIDEAKSIISAAGGTFHKALAHRERTFDASFRTAIIVADFNSDKVAEVYEPEMFSATITPIVNDTYYLGQKNLFMLNIPSVWKNMPSSGSVIKIAVVDSGICSLEDLNANIIDGYDCISDDDDPTDIDANDVGHSHGSLVASIIAAVSDNGLGISGIGLNKIKIIPIRVMSKAMNPATNTLAFSGTPNDIAAGIDKAVELGAQVINLSLGSATEFDVVKTAINNARHNNVIVVAAAGNNSEPVSFPARMDNVIAVGAVDYSGKRADYSNYGSNLNLMAPGSPAAISIFGNPPYQYTNGTSMSAPQVSAIAALLLYHGKNAETIPNILKSTAFSLGTGNGNGLVNPMGALYNDKFCSNSKLKIRYRKVGASNYSYAIPTNGKIAITVAPSSDYEIIAWIDSDSDNIIDTDEKYDGFSLFPTMDYSETISFVIPQ